MPREESPGGHRRRASHRWLVTRHRVQQDVENTVKILTQLRTECCGGPFKVGVADRDSLEATSLGEPATVLSHLPQPEHGASGFPVGFCGDAIIAFIACVVGDANLGTPVANDEGDGTREVRVLKEAAPEKFESGAIRPNSSHHVLGSGPLPKDRGGQRRASKAGGTVMDEEVVAGGVVRGRQECAHSMASVVESFDERTP
ncbi:hypothetical protein B0T18DRAFT_256384 [Schizothecium vesticola]|uniref:Uncharacterized protein n=1 Tax=Schizothecium vesticola TaxID=314040 RepID=A0AA40EIM9_9PEZI|nr:hypothetical protein B0T18DRAFT_256384 [Schizothecium vesticola]